MTEKGKQQTRSMMFQWLLTQLQQPLLLQSWLHQLSLLLLSLCVNTNIHCAFYLTRRTVHKLNGHEILNFSKKFTRKQKKELKRLPLLTFFVPTEYTAKYLETKQASTTIPFGWDDADDMQVVRSTILNS